MAVIVTVFGVVLVTCVTVGAATVGTIVSAGAVTVTVATRLSTAAAPLLGVTVNLKVSVESGAPTASAGAVNVADGVFALASVTAGPDSCDHLKVTSPVGTLAATLWLPSSATCGVPDFTVRSGPTTAHAFRTGLVAPGHGLSWPV